MTTRPSLGELERLFRENAAIVQEQIAARQNIGPAVVESADGRLTISLGGDRRPTVTVSPRLLPREEDREPVAAAIEEVVAQLVGYRAEGADAEVYEAMDRLVADGDQATAALADAAQASVDRVQDYFQSIRERMRLSAPDAIQYGSRSRAKD